MMRAFMSSVAVIALLITGNLPAADPDPAAYKAGVASKVITPPDGLWMAGYAGRNKPNEGKVHDLFVKAVAIEDPAGGKLVLVTSDLIAIPRSLSVAVADEVKKRTGLARERLMITASHTHCGPVVKDSLTDMYDMPAEQHKKIAANTEKIREGMIEVIETALKDLKPARLSQGNGTARFAINRRESKKDSIVIGLNPDGPVDHDVPVLRVETPEGKLRAIVFGYACHNTTLDFYQYCGDYAGFAQAALEKKHPEAVAMFWSGCGGDANPNPRRTLELAEKHGKALAESVEGVLAGKLTPVRGACDARYATTPLPLGTPITKEQITADLLSKQFAVRKRAERFTKILEGGGKLDVEYPHYPVQVWRLGDDILWVGLGGEVVVDYALRLKKELPGKPVWVTAYANDVMAYIPSERVLKEGGYEGNSSMIYYGFPAKWKAGLEDRIVGKASELAKEVKPKK